MTVLKIRDIESAMRKKGFQYDPNGNKHKVLRFYHEGKMTTIKTHYSHSAKEIGDRLLEAMGEQIYLTKNEFCEYVHCDISEKGYVDIIKARTEF